VLEVDAKEDLDGDYMGPLEEVEFWKLRARNLRGIANQLDKPEIGRVRKVLEKSPHLKEFNEQKELIMQQ